MSSVVKNPLSQSTGRVPLSTQIAEMLVRDIQSGVLPDGERLPPERSMAHKLGIAVGTLRKALAELEEQGLLSRVQGSGNYVNRPMDVDNVYSLFRLERVDGGGTPSAELLSLVKTERPAELPQPSRYQHAFRFRRVRSLDATPSALEEIWVDGRYADDIDSANVSDALYRYYHEHLGLRITRAEDRVSVAPLPDWAPAIFKQRDISHWGYIERFSRDQDGLIAEYSRTWFDPQSVRFVAR